MKMRRTCNEITIRTNLVGQSANRCTSHQFLALNLMSFLDRNQMNRSIYGSRRFTTITFQEIMLNDVF